MGNQVTRPSVAPKGKIRKIDDAIYCYTATLALLLW